MFMLTVLNYRYAGSIVSPRLLPLARSPHLSRLQTAYSARRSNNRYVVRRVLLQQSFSVVQESHVLGVRYLSERIGTPCLSQYFCISLPNCVLLFILKKTSSFSWLFTFKWMVSSPSLSVIIYCMLYMVPALFWGL